MQTPGGDRMDLPAGLIVTLDIVAGGAVQRNAFRRVRIVPVDIPLDINGDMHGEVGRRPPARLPAAVYPDVNAGEIAARPPHHAGVRRGVMVGAGHMAVVVHRNNLGVVHFNENRDPRDLRWGRNQPLLVHPAHQLLSGPAPWSASDLPPCQPPARVAPSMVLIVVPRISLMVARTGRSFTCLFHDTGGGGSAAARAQPLTSMAAAVTA